MMICADLHLHTQLSDGQFTAEEIFQKCSAQNLNVISITDHDAKPDVMLLKYLSEKYSLPVIIGMECGTKHKDTGKTAHILGYHIKDYTKIEQKMAPVLERRDAHNLEVIRRVNEMGFEISEAEVRSVTTGKTIYRQHILYTLYKKGYLSSMWGDWYKTMFKKGGPLAMKNSYPEPAEIISLIKEAGGTAVLAHPGQQKNLFLVPELIRFGLEGLEYIHPSNSVSDKKEILNSAKKHNLFLTGGSDFHGIFSNSGGMIGDYSIHYEKLPEKLAWSA